MGETTEKVTTRKVAINACHGGFRLSDAAFIEFMRRKGITVYADPQPLGSNFWKTPLSEQPEILRTEWYRVPAERKDEYHAAGKAAGQVYQHDWLGSDKRDDPDLIAVLEQFGDDARTKVSAPDIVEIPADVEWQIDEYDGLEWVAEKHRTWC
jgi:hypothetical protein